MMRPHGLILFVLLLGQVSSRSIADEADALVQDARKLIEECEKLRNRSQYREAIRLGFDAVGKLDRAVELRPKDAIVRTWRAWAKLQGLFDEKKAIDDANEALKLDPKLAFAYRVRGLAKAKDDRPKEGLADLNEAIRFGPHDSKNHVERAKLLLGQGQSAKALADFDEAIRLAPSDPEPRIERGSALVTLGREEDALEDAEEAMRLQPNSGKAHMIRAMMRMKKEDFPGFVEDVGFMLAEEPNAEMFAIRASVLAKIDRREDAIKDFTEAIRLEPSHGLYAARGSCYEKMGKHLEAICDFNDAISEKEKPEYYLMRGQSFASLEKTKEALEDYDEALSKDLNSSVGHALRGQCFLHAERYERAHLDFTEAIRLDPDQSALRLMNAWALLLAGRDEAASKEARTYLDREGFRLGLAPEVVLVAALADRRSHHDAEAKTILKKGLVDCPEDVWPRRFLLFLNGELDEAQLLAQSKNDQEKATSRAIIGLERLFRGDVQGAEESLRWARDHGDKDLKIMMLATDSLRRIELAKKR